MRTGIALLVVATTALSGCGGDDPVSAADVAKLREAKSKFLNYCGERKANGADEKQPVPPAIESAVDDVLAVLHDHAGASVEIEGEKTTVRAFVEEQEETLENCSDQQQWRVGRALDDAA